MPVSRFPESSAGAALTSILRHSESYGHTTPYRPCGWGVFLGAPLSLEGGSRSSRCHSGLVPPRHPVPVTQPPVLGVSHTSRAGALQTVLASRASQPPSDVVARGRLTGSYYSHGVLQRKDTGEIHPGRSAGVQRQISGCSPHVGTWGALPPRPRVWCVHTV